MASNDVKTKEIEILPYLVGIDDGYKDTKVALPDGKMFRIPSRARAGSSGISSIGGKSDAIDGSYETEGQDFVVADYISGEGTSFDEYPFSPLNRVVIHHALRLAGLGGKNVKIGTGLPVSHYFAASTNTKNIGKIKKKTESLLIPVRALAGVEAATIIANQTFSEGVAAWVDFCIDHKGNINYSNDNPAAVIDIGGRTTDCVTILPGWRVDHSRSGTANLGVINLIHAIRDRVSEKFEIEDIKDATLDRCLATGKITLWNKEYDIKDIVEKSRKEIGDQIAREVERRIGKGHGFEKLLFVGGGAVVFEEIQKRYPNAEMPDRPEFANARGMLKFMLHAP